MYQLYSIGYSGWTPELLKAQGDALRASLWDIRMRPWSKTPAWQESSLRSLLGASYAHIQALGNKNYNNPDAGIELFRPEQGVTMARATLCIRPVILLCGCRDHHICHRAIAAALICERLGLPDAIHLYPPARPRRVRPEQLPLL
jgi:hypothetical protein